ncbi:MAG TPA: type II toxin-antitoxin system VapC family toxin [Bryobacteraceae bacterium]|nr:type II toxin-antitoxin system VapC family toxin [Bryobacteraceae bacterium]
MRGLLLDTSAYSMLQRGHSGVRDALQTADLVYMSPIALGELHAGFGMGGRKAENEKRLARFLESPRVHIASISGQTALYYAQIVIYLKAAGRPVQTNDIWIAAGAMERGLQFVTTDSHFLAIPHILIEYYDPLRT